MKKYPFITKPVINKKTGQILIYLKKSNFPKKVVKKINNVDELKLWLLGE